MGNSKLGRICAPLNALFGDCRCASRNSIQPEGLAGENHA